jgi:hypothetical protein
LRGANCVEVPSDGLIYHFLKEIKAFGWEMLKMLAVSKLCTPQSWGSQTRVFHETHVEHAI